MNPLLRASAICTLLLAAPHAAGAQCATGCISSSSCDGTGKGSCRTTCSGGWCGCTDSVCDTEVIPPALAAAAAPEIFAGTGAALTPGLLVDCTGNVLDVRLVDTAGDERFPELPLIRFDTRGAGPDRMAVRHSAPPPRTTTPPGLLRAEES